MIEVDKLSVNRAGTAIIKDYSFTLKKKDSLAILGANGVGKTTLLMALIGVLKPKKGTVYLSGRVGFVPQLFHATFDYSVLDMVLMGRARAIGLFSAPKREDYFKAHDCLQLLNIDNLSSRSFNTLSGGQRQLTVIAQALASECEILILDEPCAALDYKNQSIVIETLHRLNQKQGMTLLFSTHMPQHALEIASDVLLMKNLNTFICGKTSQCITVDALSDLYDVPVHEAKFIKRNGKTFVPRFLKIDIGEEYEK